MSEKAAADDSSACDAFTARALEGIWEGMGEEGMGYQECVDTLGNWANATSLNFIESDYPNDNDWQSVTNITVDGDFAIGNPIRKDNTTDSLNLEFAKVDGQWKIDAQGACSTATFQQDCEKDE